MRVLCAALATSAYLGICDESSAHAECLGLAPPPPADLNICRVLVEDLLIPPVVSLTPYCKVHGFRCLAQPHCCTPGVCLLSPDCIAMQQVIEVAGYVVHAGDLYCGVQELKPEQLLSDLVAKRIPEPDIVSQSGPILDIATAYLDEIECGAGGLSYALAEVVTAVMATSGFEDSFTAVDVSEARIVPHRDSGALDLPKSGWGGTTIGSVIFLPDDVYDALNSWSKSARCMTSQDKDHLSTLVHELVHVRQYRELGRQRFLDEYLVDVLLNGYHSAAFETEAYGVEAWLQDQWSSPSFSGCPASGGGSGSGTPACQDGTAINCQRPDGTGSYKICYGGSWGTCI